MTTAAFGGRIPLSLQKIFMASNQGEEVYTPPTDNTAFKVYGLTSKDAKKPVLVKYASSSGIKRNFASVPPQAKFHMKLKERGYSPRNYAAKRSAYHNDPTEHQLNSYGNKILDIVKRNQVEDFRKMLEAGLSPNACNEHGESLLHMVCRHGKVELFNVLLAFDVDLQQTDDYGRTPMHDACWAANPSFDIAQALIKRDPNFLFLFDSRGSLPLSYVCKPLYGAWNDFLATSLEQHFPANRHAKDETPLFCTMKPNTRPVPDPKNKMPAFLVRAVAMGEMTPYEALMQMVEDEEDTVLCTVHDSDDESSYYDSDEDSDFDSDEEDELYEIVGNMDHLRLGVIEEDE